MRKGKINRIVSVFTLVAGAAILNLSFQNCSGAFTANGLNSLSSASVTPPQSTSAGNSGSQTGGSQVTPTQSSHKSYTGWPLQFIGTDLTNAYPDVQYYSRYAVVGGLYPYTFKLLQAPSGMQIQTRTGEIKWTPTLTGSSAMVEVQVTDSAGATATHSYTINVTTRGFYFIDATNGSDSNAGTITQPFKTLLGVQTMALPTSSTLYFRAGSYASTGIKMNTMPSIWMAYPGDKMPTLDCQGQRTCIGLGSSVQQPLLFQGFEITNSAFKFFWLDGDGKPVTWRNNIMHGITVTNANDAYENPAFIFTSDYVKGSTPVYQNLILQNNQVYDLNNYNHDIHISPATFYDVSHSLEEDNVIHDIYDGTCIEDKDDGWYNTYRHNTCYNVDGGAGIGLYSQYSQAGIEIENNLLVGNANGRNLVDVGSQPGYIKNIYIHDNTFVDGFIGFGNPIWGQGQNAYVIAHNIFYDDSQTAPLEFIGANGSYDPSSVGQPISVGSTTLITASDAYVSAILTGQEAQFENNLYWSPDSTQKIITWSWQQHGLDLAGWQKLNIDSNSIFFMQQPMFSTDGTYSLSPSDPNYGQFGKDFSAGVWQ